jgi:hypothetical protein
MNAAPSIGQFDRQLQRRPTLPCTAEKRSPLSNRRFRVRTSTVKRTPFRCPCSPETKTARSSFLASIASNATDTGASLSGTLRRRHRDSIPLPSTIRLSPNSGLSHQPCFDGRISRFLLAVSGQRSAKVTANALSVGFHRIVNRARPCSVGSPRRLNSGIADTQSPLVPGTTAPAHAVAGGGRAPEVVAGCSAELAVKMRCVKRFPSVVEGGVSASSIVRPAERGRRGGPIAVREGGPPGRSRRTSRRSTAPRCRRRPTPSITDRVFEELVEWLSRPLEEVYAAVFIDAICGWHGQGSRRPDREPADLRRDRGHPGR